MSNFKIVKKGYSQLEVDSYIEKLKADYEAKLAEQKDRIFYLKDELDKITNSSDGELVTSLVGAVERAKQIETSSKNIYELETKKLSLLYSKMEKLLTDENINNDRSVKKELLLLIQDCRSSLTKNINAQSDNVRESSDPVKELLSKMIGFNQVSADYKLTKAQTKAVEEKNKQALKVIPTSSIIRKEVPSSVKIVQVNYNQTATSEKQQTTTRSTTTATTATSNEFNKYLSKNSDINGANFESIMFSKSSGSSSKKENENLASSTYKSARASEEEKLLSKSTKAETNNKESLSSSKKETSITEKETSSKQLKEKEENKYSSLKEESKAAQSEETSRKTKKEEQNEVIVSSKSKQKSTEESEESDLSLLGIGASIFSSKYKKQESADGKLKAEKGEVSVSGSSGNTNYSASANYASASYETSSTSSNANDELSDEEFLRAYLGDLEYEESQRELAKNAKTSSTKSSITISTSSKKSSSETYVKGGKIGDYSPNETGFDLKEAVNPKEDLDEIMKAFDFFNDNKKDNKKKK